MECSIEEVPRKEKRPNQLYSCLFKHVVNLCFFILTAMFILPLCFDVRACGAFRFGFGAGFEDGFGNCNIGFVGNFDVG